MRRLAIRLIAGAGLALVTTGSVMGATDEVTIQGFAFAPDQLTVSVGDSVTWTNRDTAPHTATASDQSFNTGLIQPGASATVTFRTAGSFPYYCTPHRQMVGTVNVVPAAPATDTAALPAQAPASDSPTGLLLVAAGGIVTLVGFLIRAKRRM